MPPPRRGWGGRHGQPPRQLGADLAIRNGRTAVRRIFEPSASDEDVTNLAMTGSLLLKAAWEGRDQDVKQELHKIKTSGNELSGDRMKVDVAADNKVTALHLAARGGHPVVVRLLADAKADLRAQSSKGAPRWRWRRRRRRRRRRRCTRGRGFREAKAAVVRTTCRRPRGRWLPSLEWATVPRFR